MGGGRELSANSHIETMSLGDLGNSGMALPRRLGGNDESRNLTGGKSCAIMGNSKWWSGMSWGASFAIDAIWRSTPIAQWGDPE